MLRMGEYSSRSGNEDGLILCVQTLGGRGYGKLLVALLAQKLIRIGRDISSKACTLVISTITQSVA